MIIPATNRATEAEIADALIDYLNTRDSGAATFDQIFRDLGRHRFILLSDEDRKPSKSRPTERIWEGIVRNIGAHQNVAGNAVCEGKLVILRDPPNKGGGFILPEKAAERAAKAKRWRENT